MLNPSFQLTLELEMQGHFDFFKDIIFIALIYKICDITWKVCFVLVHLRTDIIYKPIWNAKINLLQLK